LVANGLDQVRGNLQDRLYNLFTLYSNYTTFSNTAFKPATPSSDSDSLEAIHDDIHVAIGGDTGGHMGVINVAAFDPIFYLHHTAVDRAFAIWQALYPESYVEPETSDFETFTISPGDIEDVNSGLTPFHTDTTGDLWTSVSARSTGTFGYSYPELPFWTEDSDPSAYQASLRSKINELYGPPANTTPLANTPHTKRALTTNSNQYREWIANIRAQRFAMTGSFFVRVFLGDFNPDPAQWSFDPNLVGTHGFFGGICKDCQNQDSALVSGAVPLTTALLASIRNGYLASLEPDDVEPYLRTNMHWRVSVVSDPVPITIWGAPDFV
jgi:tyrosinase